jgi:hypothetical protein
MITITSRIGAEPYLMAENVVGRFAANDVVRDEYNFLESEITLLEP